ncbi:TPA: hypothetical protein L9Y92_001653 [Klebsiella pneumoniae]|nr:hypothetical protein [Klebsiella pneumoniae]
MSLPNRLYYPIELAASKLGCTPSDLIHFGATSNVEICIHLSFHNASCDFEFNSSNGIEDLIKNESCYVDGKYNSFQLRSVNHDIYINDFYGLAVLPPQDLLAFDFNPEKPVLINHVLCPVGNGELFDEIIGAAYIEPDEEYVEELTLSNAMKRLFITDTEVNRLLESSESQISPSLPEVNKKSSSKTANSQAKFIKSLLQIHYGADVANSPRQHLERKSSGSGTILADFEDRGLKAPSGVVVDKWLKFIDVDDSD